MNTPYKKQFSKEGLLLNPITKGNPYQSVFKNRSQRRHIEGKTKSSRPLKLILSGDLTYKARIQYALDKVTNKVKQIIHYDLKLK